MTADRERRAPGARRFKHCAHAGTSVFDRASRPIRLDVQPAFARLGLLPPPASGANVFAATVGRVHGAQRWNGSPGRAARVRDVEGTNVSPNLVLAPVGKGLNFTLPRAASYSCTLSSERVTAGRGADR